MDKLNSYYTQLIQYRGKPLTRSALLHIELLKESYKSEYQKLENRHLSLYFENFVNFITLYKELTKTPILAPTTRTTSVSRSQPLVCHRASSVPLQLQVNSLLLRTPLCFQISRDLLLSHFRQYFLHFLYTPRPLALPSPEQKIEMANFDFNTGLKLHELSSTRAADIQSFLDLVKCYHDTLSAESQTSLIAFLRAAKITGEAKIRLGSVEPNSLQDLQTALFTNVLAAETEEELLTKLGQARQGRRSLKDFASYLADLSSRLTSAMMRGKNLPETARATVKITCDAMALRQFKNSCHEEVKLVLAASRVKTLDEALAVATSSNLDTPSFSVNYHRQQSSWNSRRNNKNNNYRSNQQRYPQQQQRYQQQRPQQQRPHQQPRHQQQQRSFQPNHQGQRFNNSNRQHNYNNTSNMQRNSNQQYSNNQQGQQYRSVHVAEPINIEKN